MPWTKSDYPDAMKNMNKLVREKAVSIANELVDEGDLNEGNAIATAISRARDWAENNGIDTRQSETTKDASPSQSTDDKKHGQDQYVIPHEDGWAVKKEGGERVSYTFDKKEEAVAKAKDIARNNSGAVTIQRADGTVQDRVSYNKN